MSKTVLVPEFIAETGKNYLLERGYTLKPGTGNTKESMMRDLKGCDGVIVRISPCSADVLAAADSLKVIGKHGIGVDNIDVPYCTAHGIQVTFTPLANAESVAEQAVFLMFACAKNATLMFKRFTLEGDFDMRNKVQSIEILGKTMGILGTGRIGQALARRCVGLGMTVLGYDPYMTQEQVGPNIKLCKNRDEVFQQADFISLHLPCTPETANSIGSRDFGLMRKTAVFINASRGGVVIEADLIKALQEGVIAGAGIDVFEKEPPSLSNPLMTMDNVVTSPHYGGGSTESMGRMSLHAAMSVDEVLSGKPVSWPVNKL